MSDNAHAHAHGHGAHGHTTGDGDRNGDGPSWTRAATMLQDAAPITVPDGASAMTIHVAWEPGDPGRHPTVTPARPSATSSRARSASNSKASPSGSSRWRYLLGARRRRDPLPGRQRPRRRQDRVRGHHAVRARQADAGARRRGGAEAARPPARTEAHRLSVPRLPGRDGNPGGPVPERRSSTRARDRPGRGRLLHEVRVVLVEERAPLLLRGVRQLRHLLEVLLARGTGVNSSSMSAGASESLRKACSPPWGTCRKSPLRASIHCTPSNTRTVPSRM